MKTKEESIKQAWGNNIPNGGIDENGWSKKSCTYGTFDVIKYDQQHYLEGAYIRPKSLKGIENNNGWIKIESEKDLPKENGECFVIDSTGKIEIVHYRYLRNCILEGWPYTHYQPINKPLKPLY